MVSLDLLKLGFGILITCFIPSPLLHFTLFCGKLAPFDSAGKHKFTKHGGSRCIMGNFAGIRDIFFEWKEPGQDQSGEKSLEPRRNFAKEACTVKCCRMCVLSCFSPLYKPF